jgi:hypothetical protein
MIVAYRSPGNLSALLSVAVLAALSLHCAVGLRSCWLDASMVLVMIYDIPLHFTSRYPANGSVSARTVSAGVLLYSLVRLTARTPRQILGLSALMGAGGVFLGWSALSQAGREIRALEAVGLSGLVAFRSRLVGSPWILGEWFTLVLLTLPFAFAVPAFFRVGRQWVFATLTAPMALVIAAALFLSCSRAVAGGVAVFVVVAIVVAAAYRVVRMKIAVIMGVGTLCALGLVLVAENAVFPGIAEAYTGRHTSQVRRPCSTTMAIPQPPPERTTTRTRLRSMITCLPTSETG